MMYKHRSTYWSCTKFADWLRGKEKPSAASAQGWRVWKEDSKKKHPIRFWIAEELLDTVQNIVFWPRDFLYSIKYYIVNRWVDQSHALVAHRKHIKPGEWMDYDQRILYCLFDELVDFVEIEKAYSNYRWSEEKKKDMKWWQVGIWRTRTWRSEEAGVEHLKWEMTLTNEDWLGEDKKHEAKPTSQAIAAKEIYDLYTWWTKLYPHRPEPYDVSGWSEYCDKKRQSGIGIFETDPNEDKSEVRTILDKSREVEAAYQKEDTEMLIRLIKLRGNLWT